MDQAYKILYYDINFKDINQIIKWVIIYPLAYLASPPLPLKVCSLQTNIVSDHTLERYTCLI